MARFEEVAATVREYFEAFLKDSSEEEGLADGAATADDEGLQYDYLVQCREMRQHERSTLFVDYLHLQSHDTELADAIQEYFHLLEPELRQSVAKVMGEMFEGYAQERDFYVSLPHLIAIRDLRTERIAWLIAFSGTVTRTSDVKPELLAGAFQCEMCGTMSDFVRQQFKYTQPVKCKNPTCVNRVEWSLRHDLSKFVDWQRAGDKCIFAGTLVVILDVAQLSSPGEKVEVVNKIGRAHV